MFLYHSKTSLRLWTVLVCLQTIRKRIPNKNDLHSFYQLWLDILYFGHLTVSSLRLQCTFSGNSPFNHFLKIENIESDMFVIISFRFQMPPFLHLPCKYHCIVGFQHRHHPLVGRCFHAASSSLRLVFFGFLSFFAFS